MEERQHVKTGQKLEEHTYKPGNTSGHWRLEDMSSWSPGAFGESVTLPTP